MNILRIMFFSLGALALGACSSTPKQPTEGAENAPVLTTACPTGGGPIHSRIDLVRAKVEESGALTDVKVDDLRCAQRGGRWYVEVDIGNDAKLVRHVAYRFRWTDAQGMQAGEQEAWKPLLLYGDMRQTVTTYAPTPQATDFRFVLLDQDEPPQDAQGRQ